MFVMLSRLPLSCLLALCGTALIAQAAEPLSPPPSPRPSSNAEAPSGLALGVQPASWTTSGQGAGGFMAVQFQVALSDRVRGVGVQGGGAFNCAGGATRSAALTCSCPVSGADRAAPLGLLPAIDPAHCMVMPPAIMARRSLDSLAALRPHIEARRPVRRVRVWLHTHADDTAFAPEGLASVAHFYRARGTQAAQMRHVNSSAPALGSRWQGDMLRWLHPALAHQAHQRHPAPVAPRPEALRSIDQRPFHPDGQAHGLADTGWLYVPARCEPGARTAAACQLHVHFHPCAQEARDPVGMRALHAWAETLGVVVLHPQARATDGGADGGTAGAQPATANPGACWDFWGASTGEADTGGFRLAPAYARADAPQIQAVRRMMDAVSRPAPR